MNCRANPTPPRNHNGQNQNPSNNPVEIGQRPAAGPRPDERPPMGYQNVTADRVYQSNSPNQEQPPQANGTVNGTQENY